MSKQHDGGPAFPVTETAEYHAKSEGMTLRDYFAAHALSGILSGICTGHQVRSPGAPIKVDESIHQAAWAAADKMLETRQ